MRSKEFIDLSANASKASKIVDAPFCGRFFSFTSYFAVYNLLFSNQIIYRKFLLAIGLIVIYSYK